MKRLIVGAILVLSNLLILTLCWRLRAGGFMTLAYVLAPAVFSLPWIVILQRER